VDRWHNQHGSPLQEPDAAREIRGKSRMLQAPYLLDAHRRSIVLSSIQQVCTHRNWTLLAAHVRTTHVHVVISSEENPEHVMTALKSYGSHTLNTLESSNQKRWARHGSTRYLWTNESILAAINYVMREQGDPLAVFELSVST
jgi:REP element-mobilizing transposase RayT